MGTIIKQAWVLNIGQFELDGDS